MYQNGLFWTKPKIRIAIAVATALSAIAVAVLIGAIAGRLSYAPERISASDDTFVQSASPEVASGSLSYLAAGGMDGGAAVTYLKFAVDLPAERRLARAWLWLGRQSDTPFPGMVELTHVPKTAWSEKSVTAVRAPRLGTVISSVTPRRKDPAVVFDVTRVIRTSGKYAFAVTVPSGAEAARFVARESAESASGAPTITFEWDAPASAGAPTSPSWPSDWPSPGAGGASEPAVDWPFDLTPSPAVTPTASPWPDVSPSITAAASVAPSVSDSASPSAEPSWLTPTEPSDADECVTGTLLVPTCGALSGVAPAAHTRVERVKALGDFESRVKRPQMIYHAYHRGNLLFPTAAEIRMARDPQSPRVLFLNWKPVGVSWARIAAGDPMTDMFLDGLAEHIKTVYPERFFFTMHHEPENEVREEYGTGMRAVDYAAAFRHVINRLRGNGVENLVSVMCYMAYIPWNVKPWFDQLYPGDDVTDWVGWDIYAYGNPGYGYGDFAEMVNRRSGSRPDWPGFYSWAATTFPGKPLMLAEWGVWYSEANPVHHARFFRSARLQLELFPRVKAFVYFESPNAEGRDSRVHVTPAGLDEFQQLSAHPAFDVALNPN